VNNKGSEHVKTVNYYVDQGDPCQASAQRVNHSWLGRMCGAVRACEAGELNTGGSTLPL